MSTALETKTEADKPLAVLHRAASTLSLRQLSYLVAVTHTLHFTRAAEACFVSQSTLSGGIAELERTVGATLIERDRQRVRLTPLGETLAQQAQSLLSAAADWLETAKASQQPFQGMLKLGAIPTIAPFLLPKLLRSLRRRYPEVDVLLREEPTAQLLQAVKQAELDAAFIALPMEVGHLKVLPLFDESMCLIAAADNPAAQLPSLNWSDIDLHQMMLLAEGHCLREHALQACSSGKRGRIIGFSKIEATSLTTLVQMVEAGLGVSLLPEMALKAGLLKGTKVIARPIKRPEPHRSVALITRPSHPRLALLEEVQKIASEHQ